MSETEKKNRLNETEIKHIEINLDLYYRIIKSIWA